MKTRGCRTGFLIAVLLILTVFAVCFLVKWSVECATYGSIAETPGYCLLIL